MPNGEVERDRGKILSSPPQELIFKLPQVPPSMNSAYNIFYGLKRVELKPEVRTYKTKMKQYVPAFKVQESEKVALNIEIVQNWKFKNGKWKKQDIQNMLKILIDLISEKQGWEDSLLFRLECNKIDSDSENSVNVQEWIYLEGGKNVVIF